MENVSGITKSGILKVERTTRICHEVNSEARSTLQFATSPSTVRMYRSVVTHCTIHCTILLHMFDGCNVISTSGDRGAVIFGF